MCGILCEICNFKCGLTTDPEISKRIRNRGPDCFQTTEIKVNETFVRFTGSVLWMQGTHSTIQPVENARGILLYNGDIFDEQWSDEISDTDQIMERFAEALHTEKIVDELKNFKGPFSIIYYNKQTCELMFTRDRIGRNSLLLYECNNNFMISSVLGRKFECIEIPATHIYSLNIVTNRVKLYSWEGGTNVCELEIHDWIHSVKSQQSLPDEEFCIHNETALNLDEKDDTVDFIESIAKEIINKSAVFQHLLRNSVIENIILEILRRLDKSVKIRLKRQPNKCKHCIESTLNCNHSSVGILFSGGLDCTILAFLADKYVEKQQSIDLLNVAFKRDDSSSYDVPDRLTGKQTLEELKKICPQRKWIFREINVPREKLLEHQETIIGDLVYPRRTILDESLGSALWFGAQGYNELNQSPCRILLLGSGADELFGGYTRHRNAFKRNSWTGLSKELLLDWKRISFRNLARDNRVICDHGRQPRMPYLDEDFAAFILSLKPWHRCFPNEYLGPGVGDKLFLRLVAFHLGLKNAAVLPKRALQFGSRIANKNEKGSDISSTFLKNT